MSFISVFKRIVKCPIPFIVVFKNLPKGYNKKYGVRLDTAIEKLNIFIIL